MIEFKNKISAVIQSITFLKRKYIYFFIFYFFISIFMVFCCVFAAVTFSIPAGIKIILFVLATLSIVFLNSFCSFLYTYVYKINSKLDISIQDENIMKCFTSLDYFDKIFFLLNHLHDLCSKEYAISLLHKESQLTALQRQINPHFLYNTLDSIRGLAYEENANSTAEMVECLSSLFRYITHGGNNLLSLKLEIENLDNYFHIQRFRFDNRFQLIKELDFSDSELMHCLIPTFTLQPIVENALFHGLKEMRSGGIVRISAYRTQTNLMISVEDNGCGLDVNALKDINDRINNYSYNSNKRDLDDSSGIALENVNARIKLLFGSAYGISLSSAINMGTRVEILLPATIGSVMDTQFTGEGSQFES